MWEAECTRRFEKLAPVHSELVPAAIALTLPHKINLYCNFTAGKSPHVCLDI